ncbi:MAG: hypothetical protein JWQ32_558 [Marmoricola sp.]|nr:hypothetical protein [Marmoricola sp.]
MTGEADDPSTGSGDGGSLGTPAHKPGEQPPSGDQEQNWVVSGGGLAGSDDGDDPASDARETGPSSGTGPH